MPNTTRRLIVLPLVGLAVLLVASPDFMALERAVSKVFLGSAEGAGLSIPSIPDAAPAPRLNLFSTMRAAEALGRIGGRSPVHLSASDNVASGPSVTTSGDASTRVLLPLYLSFVALQGLDVHSTLTAVNRGAAEANPIMAAFIEHPAAFVALKAGTAAGILYMTERVRRHSRLGAIVMMVAFNSAYATVVANNYRVLGQLR